MTSRLSAIVMMALVLLGARVDGQTSYRLKGTVKDSDGAPVAGARVHAEALQ